MAKRSDPCVGIEAMVKQIVRRTHLYNSDKEVADYVVSRLAPGASHPAKVVKQVRACAIKLHRKNQRFYTRMMRGR